MIYTKLKNINKYVSKSVNPMKTPDSMFEMYSVPIYDTGHPEYLLGREIGSSKTSVQKGDILLCKINPRINRVWVVADESAYPNIASSEWIVVRSPEYNSSFLAWYFKCPKFRKLMVSKVTGIGGSLTRAQPKTVAEYPVPVLPRETQNEIVRVLDKVDYIITTHQQQLNALDNLCKARFVEMFGDPITNPNHYSLYRLSDIGKLARGVSKSRPRNLPELLNGPYPLVQTGEISAANIYIEHYSSTYSELGLAQSKMWPKGTLCITIAANIAQTGILNFDACFPDSVVGFISGPKVTQLYIHFWFCFFQKILEEQAPQVAQKNINLKILGDLMVMVPPFDLQNEFVALVEQINKTKSAIQKSLKETQLLFDSLMQTYFG